MLNSLLAHCCVEAKLRRIHRFSIQEEGKTCRTVRLDNRPLLWDRGFCHLHNSTRQLYVFFLFHADKTSSMLSFCAVPSSSMLSFCAVPL